MKICTLKVFGKIYFKFKRFLRYIQPFEGKYFYLRYSLLLFNFVGAITMVHFLIIFTNCSFRIWCPTPYSFMCCSEPGSVKGMCARSRCALLRIALKRSQASYKNHPPIVTIYLLLYNLHGCVSFSKSVYNFQSMKTPVELNSLLSNFFCYTPGLLYHLIRRDYGRK